MDVGGATDRGHRLEEYGALAHEAIEAHGEREVGLHGEDEDRYPLDQALRHGGVQALEVVEVLEHAAHGHAGALRHAGRRRTEIAVLQQGDGGVDDRLTRPQRPQRPAVGG